jgi:hypothetical protein
VSELASRKSTTYAFGIAELNGVALGFEFVQLCTAHAAKKDGRSHTAQHSTAQHNAVAAAAHILACSSGADRLA